MRDAGCEMRDVTARPPQEKPQITQIDADQYSCRPSGAFHFFFASSPGAHEAVSQYLIEKGQFWLSAGN